MKAEIFFKLIIKVKNREIVPDLKHHFMNIFLDSKREGRN